MARILKGPQKVLLNVYIFLLYKHTSKIVTFHIYINNNIQGFCFLPPPQKAFEDNLTAEVGHLSPWHLMILGFFFTDLFFGT